MTIIQHGVWGFLFGSMFKRRWWIKWVSAIIGMMPDIIGFAEKIIYSDMGLWNWYLWIHKSAWYLWIIPPIGFHVLIDYLTHDENGWNRIAWTAEIVGWLIIILTAWGFYLKKSNHNME